jgi:hypothetical protein
MARPQSQQLLHHPRFGVRRGDVKQLAVKGADGRRVSLAQPHRPLDHCVKHWREITGRGIDDLQHLSSCGLLF